MHFTDIKVTVVVVKVGQLHSLYFIQILCNEPAFLPAVLHTPIALFLGANHHFMA